MRVLNSPGGAILGAPFIEKRTAEFRRTNLALFAGGFSTFALLYSVQPLMPEFSRDSTSARPRAA